MEVLKCKWCGLTTTPTQKQSLPWPIVVISTQTIERHPPTPTSTQQQPVPNPSITTITLDHPQPVNCPLFLRPVAHTYTTTYMDNSYTWWPVLGNISYPSLYHNPTNNPHRHPDRQSPTPTPSHRITFQNPRTSSTSATNANTIDQQPNNRTGSYTSSTPTRFTLRHNYPSRIYASNVDTARRNSRVGVRMIQPRPIAHTMNCTWTTLLLTLIRWEFMTPCDLNNNLRWCLRILF